MRTNDIAVRYRPFQVKYHGAGNVLGARITIRDLRHGTRVSFKVGESDLPSEDQAADHLEAMGIKIEALALADFGDGVMLLSSDFSTPMQRRVKCA